MKWFEEGLPVTCSILDIVIKDAKLHFEHDRWFICQNSMDGFWKINKLGYLYGWSIGIGSKYQLAVVGVTNLKPKYFIKEKCKILKEYYGE